MTYAVSSALQSAVFTALSSDATLSGLVGSAIYDSLPGGALPSLYVSLGPETAREANDVSGTGAEIRMTITVFTEVPGFAAAKDVAGAICDVLHEAPLSLSRGRLVSLKFQRASASRIDQASGRKIDLIFRARVEDN